MKVSSEADICPHHLDVLAITGPGYWARGWRGDRRYETVKNTRKQPYDANANGTEKMVYPTW
jgi:hypothetical protein